MSPAGPTVREALDSAVIPLRAAGVESPQLDAEVLLAAILGGDRAALHADPGRALPREAIRPFQEAVTRRRKREPVAYITGRRGFRFLELAVDPRVLIPRPETETLVEAALDLPQGARVVDVGTGSGAVALALKHERPDLRVTGSDISRSALDVARANGERLGLDVAFVLADGVPDGEWDAVVSNPPYVRDADRATLAPEITRHEPGVALFSGPTGLEVIGELVATATARVMALEVGAGQASGVAESLQVRGYETRTRMDLARIDRVVIGERP